MTSQLEQECADLCAVAQRYDARHQRDSQPDLAQRRTDRGEL